MTGEPGKPEESKQVAGEASAHVEKRTAADTEAALRQFEQEEKRLAERSASDAISEKPLPPETELDSTRDVSSLGKKWFKLRQPISTWLSVLLGVCSILFFFGLWWFLTLGDIPEERIVGPLILPSPVETFGSFKELWFDRQLTRNTWVTIRRVAAGFSLAALIGVPLGVLAGCFAPLRSLLAPIVIFGRNIPLAALIPLTFYMFGIGETQKIVFIFIACAAFIIADSTTAILDVSQKYVDTAYTLGAGRWQTIIKVLFPLAMPGIFNSLRLLFGLAFGYVMLAELVRFSDEVGGLGYLISASQKKSLHEHIYLIILIIPVIALAIDRTLYWCQRQLFPYRYGSIGVLHSVVRGVVGVWDDVKTSLFQPKPPFNQFADSEPAESES